MIFIDKLLVIWKVSQIAIILYMYLNCIAADLKIYRKIWVNNK